MKHSLRLISAGALLAAGLPMAAHAESNFTTGAGANITATARVDFSVVIPKFVFLQVGTLGTGNIDIMTFNVNATNVGDATPVAATAGSGNLTNGKVTVKVSGNNGDMSLAAANTAPLTSGSDTIPWNQITVAVGGTAPAHPAVGTSGTLTATGRVVNLSGDWTYAYANAAVVPAGTYTGRITYTAVTP